MALEIKLDDRASIEVDELKELYIEGKFDAKDSESLAEAAPLLKRLSNNRTFLADYIKDALHNNLANQQDNNYNVGCLVLGNLGRDAFLRVNCWPSVKDYEYLQKPNTDVYGIPHDHNFNFLSVGYLGSGYRSCYYEYEHFDLIGYQGEAANLRFTHERRLGLGEILLYRKLLDVHEQFPPDDLSISINIMDASPEFKYIYQYYFDVEKNELERVISGRSSPALLDIAAAFQDDEINSALFKIGIENPCLITKARAFRAYTKAACSYDDREAREELVAQRADADVRKVLATSTFL